MKPFTGATRTAFLIFFISHVPITFLVDSQALLPSWLYPQAIRELLDFYVSFVNDPLMARPTFAGPWFQSFVVGDASATAGTSAPRWTYSAAKGNFDGETSASGAGVRRRPRVPTASTPRRRMELRRPATPPSDLRNQLPRVGGVGRDLDQAPQPVGVSWLRTYVTGRQLLADRLRSTCARTSRTPATSDHAEHRAPTTSRQARRGALGLHHRAPTSRSTTVSRSAPGCSCSRSSTS